MSVSPRSRFRTRMRVQGPVVLYAALLGSWPLDVPGGSTPTQEHPVRVSRASDREIEVIGTFAVSRRVLFDAITQPEHLTRWMSAGGMTLAEAHVDPRASGTFRYVFKRPSGATIEVRGAYRSFDPPRGFAYLETYDFSPLQIEVTTALEEAGSETRFTQTMRYASTRERDEDFDGVATSLREAYAKLARYLETRKPER